jgi:hypothetical protein
MIENMWISCWIRKATDTHSQYVILTAFLQQHCLAEIPHCYCYTYIACLVQFISSLSLKMHISVICDATKNYINFHWFCNDVASIAVLSSHKQDRMGLCVEVSSLWNERPYSWILPNVGVQCLSKTAWYWRWRRYDILETSEIILPRKRCHIREDLKLL